MTTFLIVLVVLLALWVAAIEVRFHTLKHFVSESKQLAQEAAADAHNAWTRLLSHIGGQKSTPPSSKKSKP